MIMKLHIKQARNFIGFSLKNIKKGEKIKVLVKAGITSDDPNFYHYIEQISNIFLNKINVNSVYQFLILIHRDLSVDIYINDFPVEIEIIAKRNIKKGEIVRQSDIVDIRKLRFPDIKVLETDKIIFCFKVGWKFGLFFDLDRSQKMKLEDLFLSLGRLYRYLSFQYIYDVLKTKPQFEEMIKDGWFPFVELLGREYKLLTEIYQNKFNFDDRIKNLVINNFSKERIEKIMNRWWNKQIFKEKQKLLEAGVKAFLENTEKGYINCIKNLYSEIDGILRYQYFKETSQGRDIKFSDLLDWICEKGKRKTKDASSLFFPTYFLEYLKRQFEKFDLEKGKIPFSRHSSLHGVAKPESYSQIRALQTILIVDQIYFYL